MMDTAPMRVLSALALAVYLLLRGGMRVVWGLGTFWRWFPRRPSEPGFRYVYVNQDGTAREVSPMEQCCLTEDFAPGDGARPYVKFTYESRDGWGSRSGFLLRRGLPKGIPVQPVHPDYDAIVAALPRTLPTSLIWELGVPRRVWWAAECRMHLEEQRRYEALARVAHPPARA